MFKFIAFLLVLTAAPVFQANAFKLVDNVSSNCKYQINATSVIDLSSLDNAKNPFSTVYGDFTYKFNPCIINEI